MYKVAFQAPAFSGSGFDFNPGIPGSRRGLVASGFSISTTYLLLADSIKEQHKAVFTKQENAFALPKIQDMAMALPTEEPKRQDKKV